MKIYDYDLKSGIARAENVILLGNTRLTLLSDRLLRYENSASGNFTDGTTQGVWKRDFLPVPHKATRFKGGIKIATDAATFVIYTDDFNKSYVILGGKKVKVFNKGNLGGTLRTLDTDDKKIRVNGVPNENADRKHIKLNDGVVSKSGVAVFDDSKSLLLTDDKVYEREPETDYYIFAFGHDYRAAVKAYYDISGKVPLVPRFALGNWWSRYYKYTQKEYLALMDEFEEREIPLSVATVDMDWHYVDVWKDFIEKSGLTDPQKYGEMHGWTGYSWDKKLFPDYKAFLKDIKKRNLKVTLNLHPCDGVRWFEDCYEKFAKEMGKDPATKEVIRFDLTDDKFAENYFKLLHHPYEKDGVDFWWIDWQQGFTTKIKGLDPLWLLNHLHYKDNFRYGAGLILSRFCGAGAHRYPLGFSGDTVMDWKFLDYQPYFTATASNIGYTWWSHDIGGHHFGAKDNELAIRWVQLGVFSPINRLHSTAYNVLGKEPWRYDDSVGDLIIDQLKLRHKLVPYIHTYNHLTHEQGRALIEPMYYENPEAEWAYKSFNEFTFGSEMIVAPITKKSDGGIGCVTVNLPAGRYIDLFTRQAYVVSDDFKQFKAYRGLGSIPVFVKYNSIIPLSEDKGNGCDNPENLRVLVYGDNARFTMIEDNGNTARLETTYAVENSGTEFTVISSGDKSVSPSKRRITVEFMNIVDGVCVSCAENGEKVDFTVTHNRCLKVAFDYLGGTAKVVVKANEKISDLTADSLGYAKSRMLSVIERCEGNNIEKENLFKALRDAGTEEEFIKILDDSFIKNVRKEQIKEFFNIIKW